MIRFRFFFDNLKAAAEFLVEVLEYARNHKEVDFRFGPTSAQAALASGLWMEGQIKDLADSLDKIPGVVRERE